MRGSLRTAVGIPVGIAIGYAVAIAGHHRALSSGPSAPREQVVPRPVATMTNSGQPWRVVGWVPGLVKLFRDPAGLPACHASPIQVSLAGGEYESIQLVLVGGAAPATVKMTIGGLIHTNGFSRFPPDVIEVRRVGYVRTKRPDYPVASVGDWPDPLPPAREIEIPAGQVQPVWITIGAPDALPAGRYDGTVTITDQRGRAASLALQVTVWDFVLSPVPHLHTAFDFYRARLESAYRTLVPGGAAWEGRMDELERLYVLDMLKHRISPILGADPMSERFARNLDLYLRVGLGAFGIGSRGGSDDNRWPADPVQLDEVMGWYRDAARVLRDQQLLGRAYVYAYDEPQAGEPRAAQVMRAIHRADPGLRNLLVMREAPDPIRDAGWLKDADILCLRITGYIPEQVAQFKRLGKEVWMYVSGPRPPYPTLVIDYPAMAYRVLPWMCWKYGATGLLYWCVNYWSRDPWADPASFDEQNGSGMLYYPAAQGPVPSIRLEVLRDGLEDYEYLYRLRELMEQARKRGGVEPSLLERAERLAAVDPALVGSLRSYSKDASLLLTVRERIAGAIEELQSALAGLPVRR